MKHLLTLSAIFLLISNWFCNSNVFASATIGKDNRRILGISEFPWLGKIVLYKKTKNGYRVSSTCSGTLISPQYVLTAGHCVTKFNQPVPEKKYVLFLHEQTQSMILGRVIFGINQSVFAYNTQDWAIIKLISKIRLDSYPKVSTFPKKQSRISAIGYPGEKEDPYVHENCFVKDSFIRNHHSLYNNCDMTPGMSGGPILINFQHPHKQPEVVGVISSSLGSNSTNVVGIHYGLNKEIVEYISTLKELERSL